MLLARAGLWPNSDGERVRTVTVGENLPFDGPWSAVGRAGPRSAEQPFALAASMDSARNENWCGTLLNFGNAPGSNAAFMVTSAERCKVKF